MPPTAWGPRQIKWCHCLLPISGTPRVLSLYSHPLLLPTLSFHCLLASLSGPYLLCPPSCWPPVLEGKNQLPLFASWYLIKTAFGLISWIFSFRTTSGNYPHWTQFWLIVFWWRGGEWEGNFVSFKVKNLTSPSAYLHTQMFYIGFATIHWFITGRKQAPGSSS